MAREAQDGIKTVECLRGRLLAERMASKSAKAEADQMAKRLAELEKQVEEEMKQRERAEKRLKLALKMLESLKLMDLSDSYASSSSSNICFVNNGGFDVETLSSWNKEGFEGDRGSNSSVSQEYADGVAWQSSESTEKLECNDNPEEYHIEERLALVPVSMPEEQADCNQQVKNNVYDVLFALRHVREQLQNSIGRTVALYSTKELHGQQRTSTISMEAAPTK